MINKVRVSVGEECEGECMFITWVREQYLNKIHESWLIWVLNK